MSIDLRALRCILLPPFHHDWKTVEDIDEERQAAFVFRGAWADPTQRRFREYHLRCERCSKETWMRHTDAPMWVRYMR